MWRGIQGISQLQPRSSRVLMRSFSCQVGRSWTYPGGTSRGMPASGPVVPHPNLIGIFLTP